MNGTPVSITSRWREEAEEKNFVLNYSYNLTSEPTVGIYIEDELKAYTVVYSLCEITTVILNLIVILTFIRDKEFRSRVGNYYQFNLAMVNYMLGIYEISIIYIVDTKDLFIPCKIQYVVLSFLWWEEFMAVCGVAIDRIHSIVNPLRYRRQTKKIPIVICIAGWLASFFLSYLSIIDIPNDVLNEKIFLRYIVECIMFTAVEKNFSVAMGHLILWFSTSFVLVFLNVTIYGCMKKKLFANPNLPGSNHINSISSQRNRKNQRKSTKMLSIIVIFHTILWIPQNLVGVMLSSFSIDLGTVEGQKLVGRAFLVSRIYVCGGIFDPIIYCVINKSFYLRALRIMFNRPPRKIYPTILNQNSGVTRTNTTIRTNTTNAT